jgi:hypothetical protein
MKVTLLSFALFSGLATANIIFNHVALTCEPGSTLPVHGKTGCLRGQICADNGS